MVPLENNKPVIQYMNNIVLQPMYKISQGVSYHVIDLIHPEYVLYCMYIIAIKLVV